MLRSTKVIKALTKSAPRVSYSHYSTVNAQASASKTSGMNKLAVGALGASALLGVALWSKKDELKSMNPFSKGSLHPCVAYADSVPHYGVPGTKKERTFIAVKPDGVQRGLVGEVIKRFEAKGYRLVAIKMVQPTKEHAEKHYSDLSSKPFFKGLVSFFSSGPVVAMVWEGDNVIAGGRSLIGATNPRDALPGSLRGDLCVQVGRNVIHGSDSPSSAQHEISMWFTPQEVTNWTAAIDTWVYEK